jgi:chemosensory pili system protein ChpE
MGLAFAPPPGVVTTETLRRGMRGGFADALSVQIGSFIGDASYAIVALAGLAAILQAPLTQILVGGAGSLFLLYLARQSLRPRSPRPAFTETSGGNYGESSLSVLKNYKVVATKTGRGEIEDGLQSSASSA